jgi:hypothetical protein
MEGLEDLSRKLPFLLNTDEKGTLEVFFDIVALGLYHIL